MKKTRSLIFLGFADARAVSAPPFFPFPPISCVVLSFFFSLLWRQGKGPPPAKSSYASLLHRSICFFCFFLPLPSLRRTKDKLSLLPLFFRDTGSRESKIHCVFHIGSRLLFPSLRERIRYPFFFFFSSYFRDRATGCWIRQFVRLDLSFSTCELFSLLCALAVQ